MSEMPSSILRAVEEKLGEEVTIKPYEVAYGMASYCRLTGTSGKKFTVMFSEKSVRIVIEEKDGNIYEKNHFLVEEENIRTLSRSGIDVPAILHAGDNFIIWPYLGENLPLDDSFMSGSRRLDEAVLRIMERLAAIHCLPINTIPHRAMCNRSNLEFSKNYSFAGIIGDSGCALAKNIKNSKNYGRLCELIGNLSGITAGESVTKREAYNPETIFLDGDKIHLTDYKFTGIGNLFFDILYPVSWGLPADADEAVSKKQERVRRYLSARKMDDEQGMFLKFDYFTILESLNMADVLNLSSEKAKILFKTARKSMEHLISGDTNLDEARKILLSLIPELH